MRRRYVATVVEGSRTFAERDIFDAVWTSLVQLFGEVGASQAELYLVEYDEEKGRVTFRCSHKSLEMTKASIAATTEVANQKASLRMIRVSGTLRSLRTKTASR